jgi:hypothetical protein
MDAFVMVQTYEYHQSTLQYWTPVGSATLSEVLMAMHRHAAEGKPLFAYFGNARPTYPVFNEFVSHAHFLPQDHEEALAQLDAMVLRA